MENKRSILKNKKAAIITLGCKVNKYESDAMAEKLMMSGMEIVDKEEWADVYIINTCSVTNMAQKKSRQMLKRVKKYNPEALVVAAGCYINAEHDILKEEDFADILVGNNLKRDIVPIIEKYYMQHDFKNNIDEAEYRDYYLDINNTKDYEEMGCLEKTVMDHQRAYIKIQDGCNQFCSYCLIPYTRGRVRSRKPENILSEITKLAEEGVKEFVLTGIHISSYGIDFCDDETEYDLMVGKMRENWSERGKIANLGDLVYAIETLPGVKRIRLGSLEPRIITEEFLKKIGDSDKLCPHFHLSLQSACNHTLKRMNRKYMIEEFGEKCEMLRQYFEKPAITTDVIVGFPGETDEEFAVTLANLEKLNLYEIHVFKYSVRAGTAAEKMPGQVPEEVKGKRSDILLTLTNRQRLVYEEGMSGYIDEVLVEEKIEDINQIEILKQAVVLGKSDNGIQEKRKLENDTGGKIQYFTGHTRHYVKVVISSENNLINRIVRVRLV